MRVAQFRFSRLILILPVLLAGVLGSVGPAAAQETNGENLPILSLRECVDLALQSSPSLMISEERRFIAAKDVTGAKGAFLPDVSLSHRWSKSERTDYDVDDRTFSNEAFYTYDSAGDSTMWFQQVSVLNGLTDETVSSTYKDFGGQASLNLFAGFSKFANLSAAKNNLSAAEATRDYTRELVVQDVTMAYFNLLRYNRLLVVANDSRDQAAKELERTETYFRLGSAAKSDVLQQRVRLENTKLDVVVADNNVKKAFVDLAYAMNRPLVAAFRVDFSVLDTDFQVEDVESLYMEALDSRLDLTSNEYYLQARQNDVTSASSNLLPRVDLNVSHTRYTNDSPFKFGSQKSGSTSWGYSVSWNIFDRMQTLTGRSKAKANARIAQYELEQARMNVQVEIRQLHNNLVEARERANVSRETIIQSEEELRLAQERFRVGAGTTLDIITAQVNLANSRAQEVQAMCDFLIGEAQLERAVGRVSSYGRDM
jgi:outer membrane protein TolC|nr:TolC family protein [Candidatus Krumholzibacteria bacterium]